MNILGLGLPELIVIALILLLFFGPKRLPGLFRSIGTSVSELKSGLNEGEKKEEKSSEDKVSTAPTETTTDGNESQR